MQALSARVTLGRPATARVAKKPQRAMTIASATAQLSKEQQEFLARKARESRSPAPVETRGRSTPRPRSASPVGRPSSRTPAPASNSFGYSAPAPAAANGLSAEQAEFLARKARETRSPAPVETRGRSAPRPRSASPRPTSRTPAPAASYSAPAASSYSAPAPAGGLSKEQQDFLARKARESRSPAPVETRGRSAPRPRSASPRPTSRTPAPAAPAASYSAPAASYSAPAANGLSAEQREFLERKAREGRSFSAPVETRGRSAPRPAPARPSSRTPAPRAAAPSSYSAPAASSYSAPAANGLSAEQQEFLARKAQESRSYSAPAPTRGRSSAPRRRY